VDSVIGLLRYYGYLRRICSVVQYLAERMKLVAVSGIYMRLVAECLVHAGNILLVPASFGQDSCCN
jgi:hypothetical protein